MIALNYHHLFYFYVIATQGGIVGAAEKLRVGEPTLSTQLKTLERRLGVLLFERKPRQLVLTEEGRVVLDYAEKIFTLGNELIDIMDKKLSPRPHLVLGVLECLPKTLIREAIQTVHHIHPCTVTILEGSGAWLFEELAAYRVDVVLTNWLPQYGQEALVYSRLLGQAPIGVYGTPHYQSLRKQFPVSLEGQRFILPTPHSKLRHDLDQFFHERALAIDVIVETQDTSVQKVLGCEGLGLVPLPEFAGHDLVQQHKLAYLGRLEGVTESIWLVSSPRRIQNPLIKELMDNLTITTEAPAPSRATAPTSI